MEHVHLFLSAVSSEFRSYRDSLRHDLDRPNLTVKVQEDFIATGEETLDKLDDYIRQCKGVVHLVGDMTGAFAKTPSVEVIRRRYPDFSARFPVLKRFLKPGGPALSYTQWEAWLALYHRRMLFIATPTDGAPREKGYKLIGEQRATQQEHLARLKQVERYPEIHFASADRLAVELLRSKLNDILPPLQIESATLERLREVGSSLLEVGRINWKMPQFVAPLNLDAQEEKADNEHRATNVATLTDAVCTGANLVLFGEGGIGKTTFLLELSGALLAAKCPRIPLYIDAAYWARNNTEVWEYIAARPAAQRHGLSVNELMKLADRGFLTLAVNGWNEIPADRKLDCLTRFSELTTTIPALNVVLVTRTVRDAANLPGAKHVQVRGLSWQGQSKVIRAELDEVSAKVLIELLARDTPLRHAARSPLILKGLLAQAKKGAVASSSVFDLLGAVIDAFEEDDQRRLTLKEPPLDSQHRHFLEALASHLTSKHKTTASCDEVLPVISATAKQLVDDGQFDSPPRRSDVLDALSNRHLLHTDEQTIRFAHQRFQEYFAATCLFRACVDGVERDVELLCEAVNQPFWEDALRLVAGKLNGAKSYAQARSRLVRTALGVDLGFACDLAGACALSDADDIDLYRGMVTRVIALCDSPLPEVAAYGVVCLIASGFTVFADRLWPFIESDDQQIRLNTYRLNGHGISLHQLGEGAEKRIAAWSPTRRAELMHEVAENPDNYNFLVRAANEAIENEVRAAAIAALGWNFPASEMALQAWLKAPVAVQLEHSVIEIVKEALEQGDGSDEVREKLESLLRENETDELQVTLALLFPDEIGPSAVQAVLARLHESEERHRDDAPLVALAVKHAPDRLKALARNLVLTTRRVPDWAFKIVQQESAETRAEIFETAWIVLHGNGDRRINAEVVGPLASRWQILRSVRGWLNHCQNRRGDLPEAEMDRGRQLEYLLANAPGDDLLSVVMELGESASYGDASELLGLVQARINRDDSRSFETRPTEWLPSLDTVQSLINLFGKQVSEEAVPQHKVYIGLCCIASRVAPAKFGVMLIEGCCLYLDSWTTFYAVHHEWLKTRKGQQPRNPYWGLYLVSALENWGFGALPGLLSFLDHPHANQLIPEAIVRIARRPWADRKDRTFANRGDVFREGAQRRMAGLVLQQPDGTHQGITDVVAKALGKKLTELVDQLQIEQATAGDKWNDKRATHSMRGWLNVVANMSSPEIVEPLMYALAKGYLDIYSAVAALKGLINQGAFIEDAAVVARMEFMLAEGAQAKWLEESTRHAMAELCQLMYFVKPPSLLSKPLSDYLVEWKRFAHLDEIIRHLVAIESEESWRCLLELGRISAAKGRPPEGLAPALASALTPAHFTEFIEIVADGTIFVWCPSAWDMERIAPSVIRVIGNDLAGLDTFLTACSRSGSSLAEGFACAVLTLIPDGDAIRLQYGLASLDAGKAGGSRQSAYSMMKGMFTLQVSLGAEGYYELHPKACNDLRHQLYIRAKGNGLTSAICRTLLADVEYQRRAGGRPTDEPRHPAQGDGMAWTEVLAISD